MTQKSQSFELFPEISLQKDAPVRPVTKRAKRANAVRVSDAAVPAIEAAIAVLEAHSDYRLLRRLKPCLSWPANPGALVSRIVLLDTETTGLDHSTDKVIELALLAIDVDLVSGLPVGEIEVYDGFEDPGCPIPPEVVAITGIKDADVTGQRLDDARVRQMLVGADLVIAHNAGFDRPFCEARFPEFRDKAWACSFADIDWKAQGQGSAKLESLALGLGLFYDAHRAEMDCHALLAVLIAKLPSESHSGLTHLLSGFKKSSFGLSANQAPFEAKDQLKARGYRWNADKRVWHTRLGDETSLQVECDWLKANVYAQRVATLEIEKMNAQVRYSKRTGELFLRHL